MENPPPGEYRNILAAYRKHAEAIRREWDKIHGVDMGVLTARVKHAERMMTQAVTINQGIEITFADGCKGLIPFRDYRRLESLRI
jgi:hypothetical protein